MSATHASFSETEKLEAVIQLSAAHQQLRVMLTNEFEALTEEDRQTIPIMAVDKMGRLIGNFRAPVGLVDSGATDKYIASLIWHSLEDVPGAKNSTAAFGFIRFDVSPAELIIIDLQSGRVEVLRPSSATHGSVWTGTLLDELDNSPRGRHVHEQAMATVGGESASDEPAAAHEALDEIAAVALDNTVQLAGHANNNSDIPDAVLYDAGSGWAYSTLVLPDALPTLKSRVREAFHQARDLPAPVSASRFRNKNNIYILALYLAGQNGLGILHKTKLLRPGVLGPVKSFDAARYLVS